MVVRAATPCPSRGRGRCGVISSGLARSGPQHTHPGCTRSSPAGTPRRVPDRPDRRVTAARGGDRKTKGTAPGGSDRKEHAPQGALPGRRGRCRGVPADCVAQVPSAMAQRTPGPGTQSWGHLPAEGWGRVTPEATPTQPPNKRTRTTAQSTKTQPVRRLRTERQPRQRATRGSRDRRTESGAAVRSPRSGARAANKRCARPAFEDGSAPTAPGSATQSGPAVRGTRIRLRSGAKAAPPGGTSRPKAGGGSRAPPDGASGAGQAALPGRREVRPSA
ncbi:MAG: hypothetical protein JWL99_1070 [Streptomyces oryziradicis]|nr:hypothetical protein [Actinacidiphila oryziradicis]